jgi:CRISPR/Cas system CSM-associated protein Csm2 small subunit
MPVSKHPERIGLPQSICDEANSKESLRDALKYAAVQITSSQGRDLIDSEIEGIIDTIVDHWDVEMQEMASAVVLR